MTSDNVLKKNMAVEATEVANKFVKIYYPTIRRDPKKTHQFYMDNSKFTRIEDGKDPNIVVGQQNIYKVLETISYEKIIVDHVDSQDAPNGGILIVVTGRIKLSQKGSEPEDFVQTFVLGQRGSQQGKTRQFYVCNDILRYLPRQSGRSMSINIKAAEDNSAFVGSKSIEVTQKSDSADSKEPKPDAAEDEIKDLSEAVTAEVKDSEDSAGDKPVDATAEETAPKQAAAADAEKSAQDAEASADAPTSEASKGDSTPAAAGAKKAKNSKRKMNGTTKKGEEKETAAAKEPVKNTSWAMRMRNSQAKAVAAPAPAPAVTPAQPAPKVVEKTAAEPDVARSGTSQRGRGGKGKMRGGKSSKSSFNYNDPENIALTLYVSNLPEGVQKSDIEQAFGEFGKIREIQIPNPNYCFVHYVNKDAVEAAIKARPIKLNGEDLKVDKRRPSNRSKGVDGGRGRGRGRGRHRHSGRGGDGKRRTKA